MPKIPPPGKRIQKGERRNPNGSSAKARARAAARKLGAMLTPEELALRIATLLMGTPDAMRSAHDDPTASVLEKLIAQLAMQAYRKSDGQLTRLLLEHTVGKPRERKSHEHSGPDGGPIRTTTQMTDEEMMQELEKIRQRKKNVIA